MTLEEYLELFPVHHISFDDGLVLQRDICSKGISAVPNDMRERLRDYLENALLHGAVEPHLRGDLEAVSADLA